jgi:predicted nucleic-acid-binding Zn-ribbon protein
MKKIITLILICLFAYPLSMEAQNVKKYVLLEHFTNTLCGICGYTNPDFYTAINVETNKNIHHLSIHSQIPYSQCIYYQANKTEQDARATFYGLPGTPRVSLNGNALVNAADVSANTITTAAAETSPLSLKITETTGTTRTATVTFKTVGTIPTATYKLYAAIVEKKIDYAGPNGEKVHHNVFRKWINVADTNLPSLNNETFAAFNYTIDPSWNANNIYVLAFVQNNTSKAILNSATRFDVTSATDEPSIDAQVSISPNPAKDKVNITFDKITPQYLTVTNMTGQVIERINTLNSTSYDLNISQYPTGIYFVKVKSAEGVAVKKVLKE